jgi:AcrR family transcriptional regulator
MQTSPRLGSSSEETRSRILAAAKEIYELNGTRGTTTRLVAERAGVNEATLFRHFGSKHALLVAMRQSACPVTFVESVLASLRGADLREDLQTIATSLVARMYDQRRLMCISMAEDAVNERPGDVLPEDDPEWRGPVELRQRLAGFFDQMIATGKIQGNSLQLAAFFMGMCFSYVVARKIWDSTVIRPDDVDFMVDIFLNGVK